MSPIDPVISTDHKIEEVAMTSMLCTTFSKPLLVSDDNIQHVGVAGLEDRSG